MTQEEFDRHIGAQEAADAAYLAYGPLVTRADHDAAEDAANAAYVAFMDAGRTNQQEN